ncbi:hypothetical protein [Pseudomonas sp. Marseille-Q5115]|uniref:hypothetical protein n=1 Tax=Pseudomonas sp. Marseille-Q5115 TaxID=2866593 RepID=UPI001CE45ED2|nr:hypothetical protein [Pseudomonas sp. Marseille-Q5115]
MAGLKGMGRRAEPTPEERERQRLEFIHGAAVHANLAEAALVVPEPPRGKPVTARKKPVPVRTIFSLTEEVNKQIDKLSLVPRHFKATRSDVVRAGILALRAMSKADQVAFLAQATGANPVDESGQE